MYVIAFKCLLWYQKKRTVVKIKVKEMRAFYHASEIFPRPAATASFIFQEQMLWLQAYFKPVFKSRSPAINEPGQYKPE